jgi:hypothetical protein
MPTATFRDTFRIEILGVALLAAAATHLAYERFVDLAQLSGVLVEASFSMVFALVLLPVALLLACSSVGLLMISLGVSAVSAVLLRVFSRTRLPGLTLRTVEYLTGIFFLIGVAFFSVSFRHINPALVQPLPSMAPEWLRQQHAIHSYLWPVRFCVVYLVISLINATIVTAILTGNTNAERSPRRWCRRVPDPRAAMQWIRSRRWHLPYPRTPMQWITALALLPFVLSLLMVTTIYRLGDCNSFATCLESPKFVVRGLTIMLSISTLSWPVCCIWLLVVRFRSWRKPKSIP